MPAEIRGAVITCHGKLTPDYSYIAKLREANEKIAARSEGGDSQSVGIHGFTLMLSGHLFDTRAFNDTIDCCERNGANFRVIEWEIGNNNSQETRVTIQVMSMDEAAVDKTREEVESICDKDKIKI